jgi:hypothetical protein
MGAKCFGPREIAAGPNRLSFRHSMDGTRYTRAAKEWHWQIETPLKSILEETAEHTAKHPAGWSLRRPRQRLRRSARFFQWSYCLGMSNSASRPASSTSALSGVCTMFLTKSSWSITEADCAGAVSGSILTRHFHFLSLMRCAFQENAGGAPKSSVTVRWRESAIPCITTTAGVWKKRDFEVFSDIAYSTTTWLDSGDPHEPHHVLVRSPFKSCTRRKDGMRDRGPEAEDTSG